MKTILCSLAVIFILGCAVLIKDGDELKTYGIDKKEAEDMLKRIEDTPQEDKSEYWIFRKAEDSQ